MKNAIAAIILSTLGILLIAYMHFGIGMGNMISNYNAWTDAPQEVDINYAYANEFIEYHATNSTFKRRPLTTKAVQGAAAFFNIKLGLAFVWVTGLALWLCGVILFFLSQAVGATFRQRIFSLLIFYTSYSILFVFFVTNYSYDEPIQYLFLLGSFLFLRKKQWFFFTICFVLALLAKESSIFFIPPIIFYAIKEKSWQAVLLPSLAVLLFIMFQYFYFLADAKIFLADQGTRAELWDFNTALSINRLETIVSFLLVMAVPIFLTFCNGAQPFWKKSFLGVLIINTLIVLLFTQARETRLFALPLIIFWPYAGKMLHEFFIKNNPFAQKINARNLVLLLLHALLLLLIFIYLNENYHTTITLRSKTPNPVYIKIVSAAIVFFSYLSLSRWAAGGIFNKKT